MKLMFKAAQITLGILAAYLIFNVVGYLVLIFLIRLDK